MTLIFNRIFIWKFNKSKTGAILKSTLPNFIRT